MDHYSSPSLDIDELREGFKKNMTNLGFWPKFGGGEGSEGV